MNFKKTCRSETRSISKRLLLAGPPIIAWSWGKEKSKTDRSWFDQTSKVQKNISTITPDKRTCLITLEALVKCLSPDLKNNSRTFVRLSYPLLAWFSHVAPQSIVAPIIPTLYSAPLPWPCHHPTVPSRPALCQFPSSCPSHHTPPPPIASC